MKEASRPAAAAPDHQLFHGDALAVCELLAPDVRFDLVYLDPPFNAGGTFAARTAPGERRGRKSAESGPSAYEDSWGGLERFLAMLEPRLAAVRERLAPQGTLYLHLDHRTVHHAKVLCDRLFGSTAFRGEIDWVPGNGSRRKRGISITHQTLLVYTKDPRTAGQFVWNAGDPILREPYAQTSQKMHFQRIAPDGRKYRERRIAGRTYRYFADEGRHIGSVWTDAPAMLANTPLRLEGTGYPTQKPERLLERIVRASSRPGDLVADLMCGSGTTLVVAARLARRFIGADMGALAIETATRRLQSSGIAFEQRRVK